MKGSTEDNFLHQTLPGEKEDVATRSRRRCAGVAGVCVSEVISVPSFSWVIFCTFVFCLQGTEPQREEETCALANDRISGLPLLGEGGVSMCASLQRRPHQTRRALAKWLSSRRLRTLTFIETLCAKTQRICLPGEFKLFCVFARVSLSSSVWAGTIIKRQWSKKCQGHVKACDGLPWIHKWRGCAGKQSTGPKCKWQRVIFYSELCGQVYSAMLWLSDDVRGRLTSHNQTVISDGGLKKTSFQW